MSMSICKFVMHKTLHACMWHVCTVCVRVCISASVRMCVPLSPSLSLSPSHSLCACVYVWVSQKSELAIPSTWQSVHVFFKYSNSVQSVMAERYN